MSRRGSSLQLAPSFRVFFVLVIAAFLFLVVRKLVAPVVLGMAATVVLSPIHERIERLFGERSNLASLASLLLFTVFVGAPLLGAAVLFIFQARVVLQDFVGLPEGGTLTSGLSRLVNGTLEWLETIVPRDLAGTLDVRAMTEERLQDLGSGLYAALPDVLSWIGGLVVAYVIFNLVLFFLLRDGRLLAALLAELSPLENRHTRQILTRLEATIRAVFLGGVVTAVFQASIGALGLALTGFSNFVIWGALLFVASFIPVVGSALVWAPAVIYLVSTGQAGKAVVLLGFGLLISTTDNVMRTILIGRQTALHPLILFLAVFGGLAAGGPMGLIYGLLLAATLVETTAIYRTSLTLREESIADRLD